MTTITIPKEIAKNKDLIAIPSNIYRDFLAWQKKIKSVKTFKPTLAEKKMLKRARKNFADREYITLEKLKHELAIDN